MCLFTIDFAITEKESLPVFNDQRLSFPGTVKVIKTGRTTGTTIGNLKNNVLTVRVGKPFVPRGYFTFFNCYEIGNEKNQTFFKDGDSGSRCLRYRKRWDVKTPWNCICLFAINNGCL